MKYVVIQGVSRSELVSGAKYLIESSKGNTFMDTYKESMNVQDYVTSTINHILTNWLLYVLYEG